MRGPKPPTWGQQVAPSTFELPLWRNETHGVILIESALSVHLHKGSSHKIYYLQIPEEGGVGHNELGEGNPSSQFRSK